MIRIIRLSDDKKTVRYDFLFPIPASVNAIASAHVIPAALTDDYEIETIDTTDYVKRRKSYRFDSVDNMNNAQRLAALIALNTTLLKTAESILQNQLNYTGYEIADS